jgi:anti-sigma B factor antagonist
VAARRLGWYGRRSVEAPTVTALRHGDDQPTIVCVDEFDQALVPQLRDAFAEAMTADLESLRLDMTSVDFLESIGLGVLLAAALQCEASGISFSLDPSPTVSRLLSMTALADLVHGRVVRPGDCEQRFGAGFQDRRITRALVATT